MATAAKDDIKTVSARFPSHLHGRIEEWSRRNGKSFNAAVLALCTGYLDQEAAGADGSVVVATVRAALREELVPLLQDGGATLRLVWHLVAALAPDELTTAEEAMDFADATLAEARAKTQAALKKEGWLP